MEEPTDVNKQLLGVLPILDSSGHSLYAPPLPTLPFDLVAEILCRLPVKLLLQLRCICKLWNSHSLINDSKFAKKHLSMTSMRRLYCVRRCPMYSFKYILRSYPLDSFFRNTITNFSQFEYSPNNFNGDYPRLDFVLQMKIKGLSYCGILPLEKLKSWPFLKNRQILLWWHSALAMIL